jgi:hypothetical protein
MAQVATSTALTPRAELLASLEKHNASFTTLLSLIPAQYYIQPTQEEVSYMADETDIRPTLNGSRTRSVKLARS